MGSIDYINLTEAFDKYYLRLVAYATRYVSTPEEARDIVQESFVRLWEKRDRYTDVSIGSMLYAIVRHQCLDYLKHKSVVTEFRLDFSRDDDDCEPIYSYDFYGNASNPSLFGELTRLIRKEVDKLPTRTREIFRMSRFDGLSNHEIAQILGISDVAVHKHISKALDRLSKVFR